MVLASLAIRQPTGRNSGEARSLYQGQTVCAHATRERYCHEVPRPEHQKPASVPPERPANSRCERRTWGKLTCLPSEAMEPKRRITVTPEKAVLPCSERPASDLCPPHSPGTAFLVPHAAKRVVPCAHAQPLQLAGAAPLSRAYILSCMVSARNRQHYWVLKLLCRV